MGNQQCCGSKPNEPNESKPNEHKEQHVALEGWIEKLGVIHKTWKRRWFRLEGTKLTYSNSPKSSRSEGFIYMKSVTAVNIIGQTSSWEGSHPSWDYELEIVCDITNHVRDTVSAPGWSQKATGKDEHGVLVEHERRYRLRTHLKADFDKWVDILKTTAEQARAAAPPAVDAGAEPSTEEGVPPGAGQETQAKALRDSLRMAKLSAAADAAHKAQEEADAAAKAHTEAVRKRENAKRAKAEEKAELEARLAKEAEAAQAAKEEAEQKEKERIAAKAEAARVAEEKKKEAEQKHAEELQKAAEEEEKRKAKEAQAKAEAEAAAAAKQQEVERLAALAEARRKSEEAEAAAKKVTVCTNLPCFIDDRLKSVSPPPIA